MKKENKSLFLYTALIFLVSIVMILIAFVGQNNIQKMQPETDSSGVTITEKVDQLSEENRLLLEERIDLTRKNESLTDENNNLKTQNELLSKEVDILNKFIQIENLISEKKLDEAKEIYATIDAAALNDTQRLIYDKITQKLN